MQGLTVAMGSYRDLVSLAVRAVSVRSRASYVWFGRPGPRLPPGLATALAASAAHEYLVSRIQAELYSSFYRLGAPFAEPPWQTDSELADPRVVAALSAANAGRGRWGGGWRVEALEGDDVLIARDSLRLRAHASQCRVDDGGAHVRVFLPKGLPALSPGFYTALSDADEPRRPPGATIGLRLYWHVTAGGAPSLMGAVTRALNRAAVPFRLKVADHPARFARCDAAVLYLDAQHFDGLRRQLRGVFDACVGQLHAATPAFTKPLAPGLGLAEDAMRSEESFGMARSRLLAEGIVRAHERGITRHAERVRIVAERIAESGINLEAPYLEPGSVDRYEL